MIRRMNEYVVGQNTSNLKPENPCYLSGFYKAFGSYNITGTGSGALCRYTHVNQNNISTKLTALLFSFHCSSLINQLIWSSAGCTNYCGIEGQLAPHELNQTTFYAISGKIDWGTIGINTWIVMMADFFSFQLLPLQENSSFLMMIISPSLSCTHQGPAFAGLLLFLVFRNPSDSLTIYIYYYYIYIFI